MSDNCTHDCSNCEENCASRGIVKEKQNDKSNIKKVIAVIRLLRSQRLLLVRQ